MAKKSSFTAREAAEIIYEAILESPKISVELIKTITAVIKSFVIANNVIVKEKNEEPRRHAAILADKKMVYWQRKCRELEKDPEKMEQYYKEVQDLEKEYRGY